MSDVIASWDPSWLVQLCQSYLLPGVATGFVLMVAFTLIGMVVNELFLVMRGGFFWK